MVGPFRTRLAPVIRLCVPPVFSRPAGVGNPPKTTMTLVQGKRTRVAIVQRSKVNPSTTGLGRIFVPESKPEVLPGIEKSTLHAPFNHHNLSSYVARYRRRCQDQNLVRNFQRGGNLPERGSGDRRLFSLA